MKHPLFRLALTAELAWLCGGGMACQLLPAAWAERGYWALGGEWLLIGLAAAVGGWLGSGLADRLTGTNKEARR